MIELRPDSGFDAVHEAIVEAFEDDPVRGDWADGHVEYRLYGCMPRNPANHRYTPNASVEAWLITWGSTVDGETVTRGYAVIDATHIGEGVVIRYVMDLPRDRHELEAMALLASRDNLEPVTLAGER